MKNLLIELKSCMGRFSLRRNTKTQGRHGEGLKKEKCLFLRGIYLRGKLADRENTKWSPRVVFVKYLFKMKRSLIVTKNGQRF